MHKDMQEDQKQTERNYGFNLGLPANYQADPKEMRNALYLLGHFGFKVDELDYSQIIDLFEMTDAQKILEQSVHRFERIYGPVDSRVYSLINTWYRNTTRDDRIFKWDTSDNIIDNADDVLTDDR